MNLTFLSLSPAIGRRRTMSRIIGEVPIGGVGGRGGAAAAAGEIPHTRTFLHEGALQVPHTRALLHDRPIRKSNPENTNAAASAAAPGRTRPGVVAVVAAMRAAPSHADSVSPLTEFSDKILY